MIHIVEVNPNENTGGGGCLCSGPIKNDDTVGPFVVFPATETDSNISPFAVLCANCVRECAAKIGGEVLAGGERNTRPASDGRNRRGQNSKVGRDLPVDVDL